MKIDFNKELQEFQKEQYKNKDNKKIMKERFIDKRVDKKEMKLEYST